MTGRRLAAGAAALVSALCLAETAAATTWTAGLATGSKGQAQAQAVAAPTAPAAACTSATLKTIKVSWTAVAHATSYSVYQSTTSATSGYTKVASGVTTTSWTSATLATGNYWYEVQTVIGTNWASARSTATGESTINANSPYCVQP